MIIETAAPALLAVRYDWRNNSVLFLHNLAATPREVRFTVGIKGRSSDLLINLLSENHSHGAGGRHRVLLEGYGYRWYRIGGLDYLLRRSEIDVHESSAGRKLGASGRGAHRRAPRRAVRAVNRAVS